MQLVNFLTMDPILNLTAGLFHGRSIRPVQETLDPILYIAVGILYSRSIRPMQYIVQIP
jgi:hypothetical protein